MPLSLKTVAMLFGGYILLASCSAASTAMLAVISEEDMGFEGKQARKRKREMEDEVSLTNVFLFTSQMHGIP
jgi:hypothetical protein